ncbi:MAG: hypothetical protein AAF215_22030 [Cyanobacteria bacterium P01_A01_bin.123]
MKLKQLATAVITILLVGNSLIMPAMAVPGWRFLRELFTGGQPQVGSPRGGTRSDIPYVITPRRTAILGSTPQFQWNPVPSASTYTVTLRGPDGVLWETVAETSEIAYAGSPALEFDVQYSLIIKTQLNSGTSNPTIISSADEGLPGLSFYRLPEADVERLEADLGAIAAQNLTPLDADLARARLYRDYNLMSDAIALLENLSDASIQSVALYRLLGELYLQVNLNTRAGNAFTQTRALALDTGNLAEQADANVFLAHLALGTRNPDEAVRLLNEAQALYLRLNHEAEAEAIANWLATFND